MRDRMQFLLVAAVVLGAPGCGGDTQGPALDLAGPADVAPDAPDALDAPDATASATVQVHTFGVPEARTGIATGAFTTPSLDHGSIPIPAGLTHALSFRMSPMAPPLMRAEPSTGPLVFFSDDFDVLIVSPLDHFFESLVWAQDGAVHFGVQGNLQELPAGFTHRFLEVRGRGIAATFQAWGEALREHHGRRVVDAYADTGLSRLGYWTDNGAFYYYKTLDGKDFQDTLLAVRDDADARGLPFGYFQIDSWWYFKDPGGALGSTSGLVRWEPRPDVFPEGLAAFRQRLGLPLIAHNRWFALKNDYRDDHPFVDGPRMSLPLDRGPFDEFMANAMAWGVETYEQDWLATQVDEIPYLRQGVGRGGKWMADLDAAAAAQGRTMQLCMAAPVHFLQSLDMPTVTTIRTSIDYAPNLCKECYWPQFHIAGLVAWAMGLRPFKDNFQAAERAGESEALISVLSSGMVGDGDEVGKADPALLLRTCRPDGLLLKPDRPALPLDAMFLPGARPYTVATESRRPEGTWTYVAAFHLAAEHEERTDTDRFWAAIAYDGTAIEEMWPFPAAVTDWRIDPARELGVALPAVAYDWRAGTAQVVDGPFDLPVRPRLYDNSYVVLAPLLPNGMALLGETGRFVTVAAKRFQAIEPLADAIRVAITGLPGETVGVSAFDARTGRRIDGEATIGADGTATLTLDR